jgi:Fic family protein
MPSNQNVRASQQQQPGALNSQAYLKTVYTFKYKSEYGEIEDEEEKRSKSLCQGQGQDSVYSEIMISPQQIDLDKIIRKNSDAIDKLQELERILSKGENIKKNKLAGNHQNLRS